MRNNIDAVLVKAVIRFMIVGHKMLGYAAKIKISVYGKGAIRCRWSNTSAILCATDKIRDCIQQ